MAIVNGYASRAEYLAYTKETEVDVADDAVVDQVVEAASRFIDQEAGRVFYAATATRTFDVPEGRELQLDADLLSVATLTNGDGSVIAAGEFVLLPANISPKRAIKLKGTSSTYWLSASGNTEQVISVNGSWGYFAAVPADIKLNCLEIAREAYHRRSGQTAEGAARVTQAGVVIEPADVPKQVLRNIRSYAKKT